MRAAPREGLASRALRIFSGLLVLAAFGCALAAERQFDINLPAEPLARSVVLLSKQTDLKPLLLSVAGELDQIRGNPVKGHMTAREAVRLLLRGTGWSYSFDGPSAVVVFPQHQNLPAESARRSPPLAIPRSVGPQDTSVGGFQSVVNPSVVPIPLVLVTGSLIRGLDDVQVISLNTTQWQDPGYSGVQTAVTALPIASNNAPREDYDPEGGNFNRGVALNLRGLGAGATLVLVDGHRQPYSGLNGTFVDVSTIPWSAIDHIEIMTQGDSALYGSDAIAGTVNIILKKNLDGQQTQARYSSVAGGGAETVLGQSMGTHWESGRVLLVYQYSDRTALPLSARSFAANPDRTLQGGSDFRSPYANPGNILDPLSQSPTYAIPLNQNGVGLTPSQLLPGQVNLQNQFAGSDLLPEWRTHSVYWDVHQSITDSLELFANARVNQRAEDQHADAVAEVLVVPSTNAFYVNPYKTSAVLVGYDFLDDFGPIYGSGQTRTGTLSLGFTQTLPQGWQVVGTAFYGAEQMRWAGYNQVNPTALSAALADSNPLTAFNPFADGSHTNPATLKAIQATQYERSLSTISEFTLTADGALAVTPLAPKAAVGVDLRQERLSQSEAFIGESSELENHREVASTFAQLAVPLPEHLGLTAALRYDHYSDFGGTTNPELTLKWTPGAVNLHSTWGRSYRAPPLEDLVTNSSANIDGLVSLPDPKSPTGYSVVLAEEGNSAHLRQETATTVTFGVDVAPGQWPGFTAAANLFSIDYRDQIVRPGPASPYAVLSEEAIWQTIIERDPPANQVAALCTSPQFSGTLAACQTTPIAAIVDLRLRNLAETIERGLDLNLQYHLTGPLGELAAVLDATRLFSFDQAINEEEPSRDLANSIGNPIALKARATLRWTQRSDTRPGWGVALTENFVGRYTDNLTSPTRPVASFDTTDCELRYRFAGSANAWDGPDLSLAASNITNRNPPFANNQWGYDLANTQAIGRIVTISIRYDW